jgi:dipeptidase D
MLHVIEVDQEKRVLKDVEPKEVFRFFEDLTRIPRCSGKEEKVVAYLFDFAKKHGFDWYQDDKLNVIIKKRATKGYESRPTIILQAHTDMVCEKNKDTVHDFDTDPIKVEIDGGKVIAKETTLGADDGIGVALALALLADEEAEHPNIELVCTSDEERGLVGAEYLDMDQLDGRVLINLDANDDEKFVVGSAGGPVARVEIPIQRVAPDSQMMETVKISIQGLTGGHSGEDIHRGRANSNKLMARLLQGLNKKVNYSLADISGGVQYNAIPRETEVTILMTDQDKQMVMDTIQSYKSIYRNEYRIAEPHLDIAVHLYHDYQGDVLSNTSKKKVIDYLYFCENGIIRMDMEIDDTVESSINVGTIHLEEEDAVIQMMARGSIKSVYEEMYNKIVYMADNAGGQVQIMSDCPVWEYDPSSNLKEVFHKVHRNLYDEDPEFLILHAGLECGVFAQKTTDHLDMIAAGPESRNLHTPGEYVTIESVQRFWEFFKEVVKEIR